MKKKFEVLSLSEAINKCQNGHIDHPIAVITFDDGYQNNFDIAFPILKEFGMPATIFLNTYYVDTDEMIWFCRLNKALTDTHKVSLKWDGQVYDISDCLKKEKVSAVLQAKLKEYPQSLLRKKLDILLAELEVSSNGAIPKDSPFRMLDSNSIKLMSESGLIRFGAHTHSHAILSLLPKRAQLDQIINSVKTVEKLTGRSCETFSYPNGRAKDFNSDTISLLKDCGIRYAVTTIPGGNSRETPCFELRRYGIGADSSMGYFQTIVHHCSVSTVAD